MRHLLAEPLLRGVDWNDPGIVPLRKQVVSQKRSLHQIYNEWYSFIAASIPCIEGITLELGAGEGFMLEQIPGILQSEVHFIHGVGAVLDAQHLPFCRGALKSIVMTNVLHHIPNVNLFFEEAGECVQPGGAIVMIEPWVSKWSQLIYRYLHHEPYDPEVETWEFANVGPRKGANDALPWVIFERDRSRFEKECPEWKIELLQPCMPFRYLASGGITIRSMAPNFAFPFIAWIENLLEPRMRDWAMFVKIILRRI